MRGDEMSVFSKFKSIPLLRKAAIVTLNCLSCINRVVKKNETRILFYDSMYGHINDSSEALFSWLVEHQYDEKLDIVFCLPNTPDKTKYFGKCRIVGALRGIYEYMRSKYVFYNYGGMRIVPSRRQTVVNLWHGMPLKTIGKRSTDSVLEQEDIEDFSFTLATSDLFVPIMAASFGCGSDRVRVSGLPRNDYLASTRCRLSDFTNMNGISKSLLWMPTFRKSSDGRYDNSDIVTHTGLPLVIDNELMRQLNNKLSATNVMLFIKAHPYALIENEGLSSVQYSNIKILDNNTIKSKGYRLYEFIAAFDALLTDYSSVYFDYLLLNRPIGFTLDDIESYEYKRGFNFDNVKSMMPGHHIYTVSDLWTFIDDVSTDTDHYREKREEVADRVHKYRNFRSCEQLLGEIGLLSVDDERA